ncbi:MULTISPECIES: Der GTPase-activating protein YihI [Vibrio]|uniref:Der GTPase-activating protein YihI n=1 Tax=bacterium 19MO03SA05 TaxID=2920620 RepID=A0AAU6VDK5_UNCXX|nr:MULTISPECIES: Der GTPase-activating protein YihI [Vibrio]EKO3573162.1 GTPase-activating protein [Vibrio metschnikovii]EKO3583319.1 GTPase-activating protein [Vibrio metschnikovii]EKO3608114.1 GTPase-activating protein [Vibrio metschnikovii]EKO3660011.1 GTPase-activating protein [Vibrio metschnikovii]EKO3721293.1 GTPase-activating protein [Vibrio metschnikovii]
MSRTKKAKTGFNGELIVARKRNRSEADVESRERKKLKKRKGLKSGSRHSDGGEQSQRTAEQARDPRLGSKKKIPLIVETGKKASKQQRRLDAEQELAMLENDPQLNVLLDRIDSGENLGAGLQKYVDEKLDRIEVLMKQLGLFDDAADEDDEPEDDFSIPQATQSKVRKVQSDDELLAQFENLDVDGYKQ